jgi:endonuclease I
MNREQAEQKAKQFNKMVRSKSIEYQVREIRKRETRIEDDAEINYFVPSYQVVQVVGSVVWITY